MGGNYRVTASGAGKYYITITAGFSEGFKSFAMNVYAPESAYLDL